MTTTRSLKRTIHQSTAEYLSGPEDKRSTELINGEVIVSPKPSDDHQDLAHCLGEVLRRWSRARGLGKVSFDIDMVLDVANDLVYAPDLLFTPNEEVARVREGRLYGPATLCVEIASPNDKPRVQIAKHRDYARYGVAWYWIVSTLGDEPILEEHELVDGSYVLRTDIVGNEWFAPALFSGLEFRLLPLIAGDLKAAVKGKAKRWM